MKRIFFWDIDDEYLQKLFAESGGIVAVEGYEINSERITFRFASKNSVVMYHNQNCCESVFLAEDDGLANGVDIFTGAKWCKVERVSSADRGALSQYDESYTWTYYKFTTDKGYTTMRWYGESNGYYSEEVDFEAYIYETP